MATSDMDFSKEGRSPHRHSQVTNHFRLVMMEVENPSEMAMDYQQSFQTRFLMTNYIFNNRWVNQVLAAPIELTPPVMTAGSN